MNIEFTRAELQHIRDRAVAISKELKNGWWKQAYIKFAEAVDCLDAMEARTKDN